MGGVVEGEEGRGEVCGLVVGLREDGGVWGKEFIGGG